MIAIVGGGITGLYLGYLLKQKGIPFRLYEAQSSVGGNIKSFREGPYLLETGPNSIRMNADFHHLIQDLGLGDDLVFTHKRAKKRYVLRGGRYRALPMSPPSLLFGSFLRWKDLRRLWKERKLPVGTAENESVDAFFRRRFGDLVADYMLGPFVSGIYAGDPEALLVETAFPRIKAWEQEYGSVLKGFFKGREKSEYKGIFSFREGLGQMSSALGAALAGEIEAGMRLQALQRDRQGWQLQFEGEVRQADRVVLTLPAYTTAPLLAPLAPEYARHLAQVPYPPVSVVVTAYDRSDVGHPLDGFGALNNQLEGRETLGTIFSSSIYPGRCPEGQVMLTTFVGGARHPEKAQPEDALLLAAVKRDHRELLDVHGDPVFFKVIRWPQAIPQYQKEALPAQKEVEQLTERGIYLGGNWTGGISVPSCLEKAQYLCAQLV